MALNKDIRLALLAIVSIVAMALAYMFMAGTLSNSTNSDYKVLFDNVDQLKKSDKVFLKGVPVGTVTDIRFQDIANPNKIILTINVEKGLPITEDTKVQIVSTSLMGSMGLNLILGSSSKMASSDYILNGVSEYGLLQKLGDNFEPLASSGDTLLKNVNSLFNKDENENLYRTLAEMNKSLASLNQTIVSVNTLVASNQKPINSTLSNFDHITANLANNQAEINKTIANIRSLTDKADQSQLVPMINNLNESVNKLNIVMADINSGKGTLGKLIEDPVLYDNLNTTINNANSLMIDLKANPKRYVGFSIFGGGNK